MVPQQTLVVHMVLKVQIIQGPLLTDNHKTHKAEVLSIKVGAPPLQEQITPNRQAPAQVAVVVHLNQLALQVQDQVVHLHHIADVNKYIKNIQL